MSKKRSDVKRKKQESQRLLFIGICAVVFILVVAFFAYAWFVTLPQKNAKLWTIDATTGKLSFTDNGDTTAYVNSTVSTANYTLQTIVYQSFGDNVYADLMIPNNVTRPPVVIVLPAVTINRTANRPTAEALCAMGYATLTLDERGNFGQTPGPLMNDFDTGYRTFATGGDPVQFKQIYDVLKGYDYLKTRSDVDGNDVSLLGESIGGMWSVIAGGVQPQFKGVIAVSSSDFGFAPTTGQNASRFLKASTPSTYVSSLPPRKLVMIHFDNDSIIPIADGKALYDKASEPKAWYQYNGSTHGLWDPVFAGDVHKELQGMLGR